MSKFALSIIFLLLGTCLGIIIGVKIDKDYYITGKVKQKGKGNKQDITSNLKFDKKKRRRQK